NAVTFPSPKLPMRISPLNAPKFDGASATPQGALSLPPVANRRNKLPSVLNTSTTPSPAPAVSSSAPGARFAYVTYNRLLLLVTLNGEYPAGRSESVNLPGTLRSVKV